MGCWSVPSAIGPADTVRPPPNRPLGSSARSPAVMASIGVKNGRSRNSCFHPAERENACVIPQRSPAFVESCTPGVCVDGEQPRRRPGHARVTRRASHRLP